MNTANKLTLLRVILIPIYVVMMYLDFAGNHLVALAIFVIARLTDCVDGYVARHYNQVTDFGKFMDPLADKVLVIASMVCFCGTGRFPAWALIIVIAREFAVSGLRLVAVEQGHVIAAGMSGKIKTVLQMVLAMVLTAMGAGILGDLLAVAAAAVTLYSMVEYIWQNRAVLSGAK